MRSGRNTPVSGSDRDFTYEMGQASVTVTGYTGSFGESVDLVIPSYIQGRPVVAVENIAPNLTGTNFRCTASPFRIPSAAWAQEPSRR